MTYHVLRSQSGTRVFVWCGAIVYLDSPNDAAMSVYDATCAACLKCAERFGAVARERLKELTP